MPSLHMRTAKFFSAVLLISGFGVSNVYSAIVITPIVTVSNGLATDPTAMVNVVLRGFSDSGVQNLTTYGLRATALLDGAVFAPISPTSQDAPVGSQWDGFLNQIKAISGNQFTYQGFFVPDGAPAALVQITPISGVQPGDILGSFSFSVNKLLGVTRSIQVSTAVAPAQFPAGYATGSGFFVDLDLPAMFSPVQANLTNLGNGTVAALAAVPEPSSFGLLGLCFANLLVLRRRA